MIILNIETSTRVCSAAVTSGEEVVYACRKDDGNHAHDLPLFIDELLLKAAADNLRIEAVALSQGPGSYTGLRIGTATAKGLCYGLNVPLLPVDTLQLLAATAVRKNHIADDALLCPMIDARRMEVYCALYDRNLDQMTDIQAKVISENSFAEELALQPVCFFGNGALKCKQVIQHPNAVFLPAIEADAAFMGGLAEQVWKKEKKADVAYFEPFYLKDFHATISHKTQDILNSTNPNINN